MTGEHMTPEMLAVNPWHQMPNMSDGSVNLAESGAVRLLAELPDTTASLLLMLAASTYDADHPLHRQQVRSRNVRRQ